MFKFAIISAAATALSVSALAGPILNIQITVDGNLSTTIQEGQLTVFNDYSYIGSSGDGFPGTSWVVGWDIVSDLADRSFVTNGLTIANLGSATKRFNILLDIPGTLPVASGTPTWQYFGNLGGTLTSNSSAASTLSSIGTNPLWQGLRGGTSPGTNSQLMQHSTFTSPGSMSSLIPSVSITAYSVVGGTGTNLGYEFQFDLSAQSFVSFSGNWGAYVPTPGAWTLCAISGIIIKRRRRLN